MCFSWVSPALIWLSSPSPAYDSHLRHSCRQVARPAATSSGHLGLILHFLWQRCLMPHPAVCSHCYCKDSLKIHQRVGLKSTRSLQSLVVAWSLLMIKRLPSSLKSTATMPLSAVSLCSHLVTHRRNMLKSNSTSTHHSVLNALRGRQRPRTGPDADPATVAGL